MTIVNSEYNLSPGGPVAIGVDENGSVSMYVDEYMMEDFEEDEAERIRHLYEDYTINGDNTSDKLIIRCDHVSDGECYEFVYLRKYDEWVPGIYNGNGSSAIMLSNIDDNKVNELGFDYHSSDGQYKYISCLIEDLDPSIQMSFTLVFEKDKSGGGFMCKRIVNGCVNGVIGEYVIVRNNFGHDRHAKAFFMNKDLTKRMSDVYCDIVQKGITTRRNLHEEDLWVIACHYSEVGGEKYICDFVYAGKDGIVPLNKVFVLDKDEFHERPHFIYHSDQDVGIMMDFRTNVVVYIIHDGKIYDSFQGKEFVTDKNGAITIDERNTLSPGPLSFYNRPGADRSRILDFLKEPIN